MLRTVSREVGITPDDLNDGVGGTDHTDRTD
jgi:hypothetical protein